jgi:hypothetical protein
MKYLVLSSEMSGNADNFEVKEGLRRKAPQAMNGMPVVMISVTLLVLLDIFFLGNADPARASLAY